MRRSGVASAPGTPRVLLLRLLRQLRSHLPELGEEALVDEPAEQLDRRPLRPDDLAADDPLDDLEVADAPGDRSLVELGERLGELVEILELTATPVQVDERQPSLAPPLVEGLAERRHRAAK